MQSELQANLPFEMLKESAPVIESKTKISDEETLNSVNFYASHLRKQLPAEVFQANPLRFISFAAFLSMALLGFALLRVGSMPWFLKMLIGAGIGMALGGVTFFTHELMHGSVVKRRSLQNFFGYFGLMSFFISPTFWRFWHNHLHHTHTQAIISDPDAFPILKIFKHSKFMKAMFPYTPGSGYKRSYAYFFFWFSFHVFVAQAYLRFRNSQFDKLNHRRVTIEMVSQILIWSALMFWVGPANIFWAFVLPLMIQNYFVMSYIATNHNLSPLTKINDPLVNTLTVTNHPVLEWFHMNFGYHVEHHLFPTMSGAHAKKVHQALKSEFPDRYQHMPKAKAMVQLYQTSRIYKNSKLLINPETNQTYSTL